MIEVSLFFSLAGVLAAGTGAWLAFSAKAAEYAGSGRPTGKAPPLKLAIWYLIRDQRKFAAWALLGTVLQFVSVLLVLIALR